MILRVKKLLMVLLAGVLALSMGVAIAMNMPTVKADGESGLVISIHDTASVRTDASKAIRFRTYVNRAYINANQDNVEVVTMITPTRNIGDKTFDANFDGENKKIVFSKANGNLVDNGDYEVPGDETNYWYHACIYDVKDVNIARDFSAVSYVVVDGQVLEGSYTNVTSESMWTAAERHLEKNPNLDKNSDEYINVSALCASNIATITGFDGETYPVTVKRGQTVAQALEGVDLAKELNVEGAAYYKGIVEDTSVTLTENATFTAKMNSLTIEDGVVTACTITAEDTTIIEVPAMYNDVDVTSIGKAVFASHPGIESLILPESVKTVGTNALVGLTSLKTLIMPGVNSINDGVFDTKIQSLALETITAGYGFRLNTAKLHYNEGLNKAKLYLVNMPEGFTTKAVVESEVLSTSSSLVDVTNVKLMSGETYAYSKELGGYVLVNFYGINQETFEVPEKVNDGINGEDDVVRVNPYAGTGKLTNAHSYNSWNKVKTVILPEKVTSIGHHAFVFNPGIETLIMPGVVGEGDEIFYEWNAPSGIDNLTKIVVNPAIGHRLGFNRNSKGNLDIFVLPGEGTVTGYGKQWSGKVYYYSETPKADAWRFVDGEYTPWTGAFYNEVDGGYELAGYIGTNETEIVIPATYEDKPVVSIGANAFGTNANVESVILPESVVKIGTGALSGLTGLKTLVMPGINSSADSVMGSSICSTVLETVTAGYGFRLDSGKLHYNNGTNKAKLYLVNMPEGFTTKEVAGTNDFITKVSSLVDVNNVKLMSGETYAYSKDLEGYVLVNFYGVNQETFVVPEKVNDGINGEDDVVRVNPYAGTCKANASSSFGYWNKVKTVILPESVTSIGYHCFVFNQGITTIVMPGVVGEGDEVFMYGLGSGVDNIQKLVVSGNIGHTVYFGRGSNDNVQIDVFFTGPTDVALAGGTTMTKYFYSEEPLSGAWTYDENGLPVLWDNIVE